MCISKTAKTQFHQECQVFWLANKTDTSHIGYAAFQQAGYHFYPKQIHSVPNHIRQKEIITELSKFLNYYI